MGKYLFFDIDGTLVGKSREVTVMNRRAIEKARECGHKAFLCTGRAPTSISGNITDIDFDGIVCSAGGFIMINGEFIYENFINQYVLGEVLTLFTNHSILFTLETKDALYQSPGVNEFFDSKHNLDLEHNLELKRFFEIRRENENRKPLKDFNILDTGVSKVCFIAKDKLAFYDCVKYLTEFFNIVLFSQEEDDYINGEIILKNCTKADGIRRVMEYFNDSMTKTIAFGDSMNDYQMLEVAEISAVYENAPEKLKALGDIFFEDPDDDGIFKVMRKLGLF